MSLRTALVATGLAALGWPLSSFATNGYFSHGYGVRSIGVAGVSIALPQDGLTAASNPAGYLFVGNRLDLGVSLFRPDRGATIRGNGFGADGDYSGNETHNFLIPELAMPGSCRQTSPGAWPCMATGA